MRGLYHLLVDTLDYKFGTSQTPPWCNCVMYKNLKMVNLLFSWCIINFGFFCVWSGAKQRPTWAPQLSVFVSASLIRIARCLTFFEDSIIVSQRIQLQVMSSPNVWEQKGILKGFNYFCTIWHIVTLHLKQESDSSLCCVVRLAQNILHGINNLCTHVSEW